MWYVLYEYDPFLLMSLFRLRLILFHIGLLLQVVRSTRICRSLHHGGALLLEIVSLPLFAELVNPISLPREPFRFLRGVDCRLSRGSTYMTRESTVANVDLKAKNTPYAVQGRQRLAGPNFSFGSRSGGISFGERLRLTLGGGGA